MGDDQVDDLDADEGRDQAAQPGLVLPDACSDLIWERGVGGYVAGPDTGPARPMIEPGTVIVGVRFRPSAGGQVLKTPLSEIANQRVHGTTGEVPIERFQRVEAGALRSIAGIPPFSASRELVRKVQADCAIEGRRQRLFGAVAADR